MLPAMSTERFLRPSTPAGFDRSRAAERAADPRGWRYDEAERETVHRVIAERRDVRRFRPDAVPDDVLQRVLEAAHRAPSVGLMQPWRLIVIRDIDTRVSVRRLAQRERLRQADGFDERTRHFLDQKVEGIVEAPLGVCVCCDHGDPHVEVLGRGTIPATDIYSAACAVENLWLAARAEGLGVGWVSFYRPEDLRALLGIPARVDPIAYLCLGWPDERPVRPGLEAAGWSSRMALDAVVMDERWREDAEPGSGPESGSLSAVAAEAIGVDRGASIAAPEDTVQGDRPDRAAAIAARDRLDQLVKPGGSLGVLEAAHRALGRNHRCSSRLEHARGGTRLRGRSWPRQPRHEPVRQRGIRAGRRCGGARRDGRRACSRAAAGTSCWSWTWAWRARRPRACETRRSPQAART